jgi:hypothetical protein
MHRAPGGIWETYVPLKKHESHLKRWLKDLQYSRALQSLIWGTVSNNHSDAGLEMIQVVRVETHDANVEELAGAWIYLNAQQHMLILLLVVPM